MSECVCESLVSLTYILDLSLSLLRFTAVQNMYQKNHNQRAVYATPERARDATYFLESIADEAKKILLLVILMLAPSCRVRTPRHSLPLSLRLSPSDSDTLRLSLVIPQTR
jgi:hypothetical protein